MRSQPSNSRNDMSAKSASRSAARGFICVPVRSAAAHTVATTRRTVMPRRTRARPDIRSSRRPSLGSAGSTAIRMTSLPSTDLASGSFTYAPPTVGQLSRAMEVDRRFGDLGLGLVDGSVVALAESLGIRRLATRDVRHFVTKAYAFLVATADPPGDADRPPRVAGALRRCQCPARWATPRLPA